MRFKRTVVIVCASLLTALPGMAAERTHTIEAADYFTIAGVTGLALSPDGATAAWTESRWRAEADRRMTELWVTPVESPEPTRVSFDGLGPRGIRFDASGTWIFFAAADENGDTQISRIDPSDGRMQTLTNVTGGIDLWDLAADDSLLAYTVTADQTDDEWKALRGEYPDLEYGHGITDFSEVHVLDLKTWRSRVLFTGRRVIGSFDASSDGTFAVIVTTPDNELVHNEGWSRVDILDLESGELEILTTDGWRDGHPSPFGWVDDVSLADDDGMAAFSVSFDGFPTRIYTIEETAGDWRLQEQPRPEGVSVVGGTLGWRPGSRDLIFEGDIQARTRLYSLPLGEEGGKARSLTDGDVTVSDWAYDAAGRTLVVASGGLDSANDLYRVRNGALDRLTTINPQIDTWKLPSIEVVRWKAPDGKTVEGILELPPGWTPEDGPLPMIVEIHGGPTSATRYQLRFWIYGRTLMAAKGYALLSPNYRGSTGYGDDFLIDLVGRENDIDVKDILAGVDAMVERGIADGDRLGVMGWSNGGFLTNALIAVTNRFKAASSGAGTLDMVLQWAIEDTPGHVINFMRAALPWQDPEHYVGSSPLYGMADATTPTLIHVGGDDPRVPAAHSRGLYRALKIYLGIPSELIVYPGAHHSLTTHTHRKAKMAWDLAWFEKYLGPGWEQEVAE